MCVLVCVGVGEGGGGGGGGGGVGWEASAPNCKGLLSTTYSISSSQV